MVIKMTYSDVYTQALTYTGETAASTAVSDYSDRADYLFPGVLARLISSSNALGTTVTLPSTVKIEKATTFPMDDKLVPVAAMFLAAYLVAAENPGLSTQLIKIADATLNSVVPSN